MKKTYRSWGEGMLTVTLNFHNLEKLCFNSWSEMMESLRKHFFFNQCDIKCWTKQKLNFFFKLLLCQHLCHHWHSSSCTLQRWQRNFKSLETSLSSQLYTFGQLEIKRWVLMESGKNDISGMCCLLIPWDGGICDGGNSCHSGGKLWSPAHTELLYRQHRFTALVDSHS